MDVLDIAILREMGVQPYGALPRPPDTLKAPAVARRLGVNPERVADRLSRLSQAGVLLGYEAYPNYRHLNLDVACYWLRFRDDAQASRALEEAVHVEGIPSAFAFVGGEMNASVCGASLAELDRKVALLVRLAGGGESRKLYDLVTPPVRRALDHLDWRILQQLRGDAFRRHGEIAERVGASAKTVTRRIDRMASEGAFFVIPEIEWAKAEGILLAQLWLAATGAETSALPRLAVDALRDAVITHDEPIARAGVSEVQIVVAARSMRELDALVERARSLPGVTSARAQLLRDAREDYAWVDEAIAGRIRATAPA